ncbi:uncharacterized protein LOC131438726 [Malaya genurostris]|uniref:uncharacterized protein LOC131438726 n=1 Tax=Malaya genurostris TaxID=325434 RepID=UPI0026F3C1BA|nr:uncharacterized protein LOC131438726 [Malaya genurostris]
MASNKILAVAIVLLAIGLTEQSKASANGKPPQSSAQKYFDSIPESDRDLVIRYQLEKAIEQHIEKLYPAPKNFAANLLNYVEKTYGLSDPEVEKSLRDGTVVCTPEGQCFNPGDVGQVCCPW